MKRLLLMGAALMLGGVARADLTLTEAIDTAVKNNVSVRLAAAETEAARGAAVRSAAGLLPQILATASQSRVFKQNLEASGFEPGTGFNTLLGPYNSFDARLTLTQTIFDLGAVWRATAGRRAAEAAALEEKLAEEQVASAAALAYVDLLRSRRAVEAAQADSDLATSLLSLTSDQRKAGLSTGVDVARAQTRMQEGRLRLIRAQNAQRHASLRLARLLGWPLDQPVQPAETLDVSTFTAVDMTQALTGGRNDRLEAKIAELVAGAEKAAYRGAQAGHGPTLQAGGDYGVSGTSPANVEQVGSIGARLTVPIFTGRETVGATRESRARFQQAELREEDVRKQIEEDVRLSLDNLSTEEQEVTAARDKHSLAEREMQMARDRYAAGVGDNIQIITAQNTLAQADDDLIGALARYDEARINLAMAVGHARTFTLRP